MRVHSVTIDGRRARMMGAEALLDLMIWIEGQFIGDGYEAEKSLNRDATTFRRKTS